MDSLNYLKLLLPEPIAYTHVRAIQTASSCSASAGPLESEFSSLDSNAVKPSVPLAILLLAGVPGAIGLAINCIVDLLYQSYSQYGTVELRLVVPNSAVSPIMGKGGAKITSIRETTGARLQISARDAEQIERIVHVSGQSEQVKNATRIVAALIQSDPQLKEYMVLKIRMPPSVVTADHVRRPDVLRTEYTLEGLEAKDPAEAATWIKHCAIKPQVMQIETGVHVQVPDDLVGSLMGRSGQALTDIRTSSGARITISQRGELIPGTRDRLVTIKGSMWAVHTAHAMIVQRLAEARDDEKPAPAKTSEA